MKLNRDSTSSAPVAPIYKIVLTGGPCGGKTTICRQLSPLLEKHGFRVFTVPESATIAFQSGWRVGDYADLESSFVFHKSLLRLQMCLEDRIADLACSTGQKSILLCDRGLMDISAYMIHEEWERLLKVLDLNAQTILDERYIGVIHFVTAADGSGHYGKNNAYRSESAEDAIAVDRRTQMAWKGHSRRVVITNEPGGMETKVEKALSEVKRFLKSAKKE